MGALDNNILDFSVIQVRHAERLGSYGLVFTNDTRLSDARPPVYHVHAMADITGLVAALALKEDKSNKDARGGYASLDVNGLVPGAEIPYGTTANTAAQGNDSRLSDSRFPTGPATGDLSGTYPAPTVSGWQGLLVPATTALQYVRKNAGASGWEAADEAASRVDVDLLRYEFDKLFSWVVTTFDTIPTDMEDTFERAITNG